MKTIVGYRKSDFRGDDGKQVTGYNVYLEEPIADKGRGVQCDRIYLSDQKLAKLGINLDELVGAEVMLSYNRYGKVSEIVKR